MPPLPVALYMYCTLLWVLSPPALATTVRIDGARAGAEVGKEFLSFNLDTSIFEADTRRLLNFSSPRLLTLLRGLSPAILRVGGSPADWLLFDRPAGIVNASGIQPTPVIMSKSDWDDLVRVTTKADLHLLFDLDLQLRFGTQWDPSNAIELFEYSVQRGYGENLDWELGNEPNVYVRPGQAQFTGDQIGRDYLSLVKAVRAYQSLAGCRVVGPDIVPQSAGSKEIIESFLDRAGDNVDALTIHHYYFRGDTADWTNYIDPAYFSSLSAALDVVKALVLGSPYPGTHVWLGETSDAWHGGTAGVSDRFVSGFLWLDKLGLSAQYGVGIVMRQTFWGHNYPLVSDDFIPNPDYWLSLLHKRLVGTRVLNLTTERRPVTTRVYAHCANNYRGYKPGSIVVFALNVNRTETDVLRFLDPGLRSQSLDMYAASPGDAQGLLSRHVKINGVTMKMVDDVTLPEFPAVPWQAARGVPLPPTSYSFLVFPDANFKLCK